MATAKATSPNVPAASSKAPRRARKTDAHGEAGGDGAQGVAPSAIREEAVVITATVPSYPADAYTHGELGLSADDLSAMYRNMLLQRRFEERAAQMYGKQKISGFLHLYIGQEAVSTGAGRGHQRRRRLGHHRLPRPRPLASRSA